MVYKILLNLTVQMDPGFPANSMLMPGVHEIIDHFAFFDESFQQGK